jgi:hypothetical protein
MIIPLASVSRPALGPTQPPVQWVPGVLSLGLERGQGVMLTTHPHLVLRSRMSRSYTLFPPSTFMACSGTAFPLAFRNMEYHTLVNLVVKTVLLKMHDISWPAESLSACQELLTAVS